MTQSTELEFFYDCSSPWTYFAFARLVPLAEKLSLVVHWRPILVGGVFNSINPQLYAARENMFANERRVKHYFKDMQDWSEYVGITVKQPDVFP
ncbi:MAG: DsbA family protein, partial [Halioglobus sp.]